MKLHISKNQKTAAIVVGGSLILYLLYRWYQNNAASSAASTASGQLSPVDTSGAPTDTGGSGTSWGGSGSGGTLDSDLQALMAQDASNNAGVLSALAALQPPAPVAAAAASAGSAMVSGPLNALPIAAQIALVHSGLADPSQLGPKAQQVYAHGDTTLAQYATGQRRSAPRGPTKKPAPVAGLTTAQLRTIGSQIGGYVAHNYKPHKSGSAVAPSHHGPKPQVKPAHPPALDHQTGGVKPPSAQPHVVPPKSTPHKKTTTRPR